FAQNYKFIRKIGNFDESSSFSINSAKIIYVSDVGNMEILKMDTLGTQLKMIGGFGWEESTFDEPIDIFSTPLNVYVSDKNNNRIQIFDKDLNYLSKFTTRENENSDYQFAYPTSCATSNMGDLYILDSDNSRILKYDLSGKFLLEIGNIDAGDFALDNPDRFAISMDNKIFVTDDDYIKVFDQYGNSLIKIKTLLNDANINIRFNYMTVNDDEKIKIFNLYNPDKKYALFESPDLNEGIVESTIVNQKLYVLTNSCIYIYQIIP
ncbi:NHL repeat-containing protein, partial [Bacteroidota bacterium]